MNYSIFNYYLLQLKKKSISLDRKPNKSYFYWKYIYGDFVISKFINFLVKKGKKNKAIKYFLIALFNLKQKFGINPILLVKYIILRRNMLHKVTQKKFGTRTFYYLRVLNFEKQISHTIKKLIQLIYFFKKKKKLKLWQCLFLILLNFCLKKKVTVKLKYRKNKLNKVFSRNYISKKYKLYMYYFKLKEFYKKVLNSYKNLFYLFKFLTSKYLTIYKNLSLYKKLICLYFFTNKINNNSFLNYFFYLHKIRKLTFTLMYKFITKFYKRKYFFFLLKIKKKLIKFFAHFKELKKRKIKYLIKLYKKKKRFYKNKRVEKIGIKYSLTPLMYKFFLKDLEEFKNAAQYKNSILNFRLRNKKRNELQMGTRLHPKFDAKLKHRKIFFRLAKHGQFK